MNVLATLGLALLVFLAVIIYAACYVSGSIEDLERQAELQARMMRVERAEADHAD